MDLHRAPLAGVLDPGKREVPPHLVRIAPGLARRKEPARATAGSPQGRAEHLVGLRIEVRELGLDLRRPRGRDLEAEERAIGDPERDEARLLRAGRHLERVRPLELRRRHRSLRRLNLRRSAPREKRRRAKGQQQPTDSERDLHGKRWPGGPSIVTLSKMMRIVRTSVPSVTGQVYRISVGLSTVTGNVLSVA